MVCLRAVCLSWAEYDRDSQRFLQPLRGHAPSLVQTMNPSDAELVALTLVGDTRAFGTLVARYQGTVHGLAYAIVANWAEAEDLAQAAFLRAYLQLAQLCEPDKFATWLRRVATTTC